MVSRVEKIRNVKKEVHVVEMPMLRCLEFKKGQN